MKIAQISPILEKLNEKFAGQAGVLHLENYETSGTSVRFVPEKAAETEADEARTPDRRTKISQENLKLHRRIRHLQQEPVKEKQLNKKKHKIHKNLLIICVKDYIIYLLNSIVHTYL